MNFSIGDVIFYVKEYINLDSFHFETINELCWQLSVRPKEGRFRTLLFDIIFYKNSSIIIKLEDSYNHTTYSIKYFFEIEGSISYTMIKFDDWYDSLIDQQHISISKFIMSEEEYFQQSTVENLPSFIEVQKMMKLYHYLLELDTKINKNTKEFNHNLILKENPKLKIMFDRI